MRRSLWHHVTSARAFQRPPQLLLMRGTSNYVDTNTSNRRAAGDSVEQAKEESRTATSSKSFNLMSAPLLANDKTEAAKLSGRGAETWQWYKVKGKRYRRKSKRWADMDRTSFCLLLREQMSSSKVSSVLRKFMDEFPILNNHWSDQELVMIVCALIKMNRSESALQVLRNQIEGPDRDRLNRIAAASARLGNARVAQGVLEITKHFQLEPDVITFTSVIHACARGSKSDVPIALNVLNDMIYAGVKPNARTYGAIVLAYARLGRWEEIHELLSSTSYADDEHKAEVFTCAIISCSRNHQHDYASRLFALLLEDGVYPGDNVCNSALSSCARTSNLTQLRRILKLVECHATPSTYSYNCMISAHGNACKMDDALRVFEEMRDHPTVSPDIVSFNSLLGAAVRSRNVDRFPFILSLMGKAGLKWNAYTLNILLQGCALSGDVQSAERYWSEANWDKNADSDQPLESRQCVTFDRAHFETLMSVYYAAKDYQSTVDMWMKDKLCRRRAKSSKALNFLIRACAGLKDGKLARTILAEFADRGHPVSSITHNHMLEVFLAADKFADASAYLQKMIDMGGMASTFSFTVLMMYLAKHDRHSDVIAMFDLYLETRGASSKGQNPLLHYPADAIYVLTMRAAVHLQDHETVLAIYDGLPAPMSMAVRTELLVLAISSCEREGDWRAAVTMFDESTGKLDAEINVELYKQVVKIVASAGEFDRALDVGGGQWYRQNRPDKGWGL
uniref:Pentacotripeptide-repeat region of PRORP domain-containing protein n=1 Tax=Peronospora matthiolae TaxID=2874970 RepID=A0AAV1VDW3_9STRA